MKAVAVLSPGQVATVDLPMPHVEEYECLVKVTASGLCNSTDLKIIDNEIGEMTVNYPIILGHEGVGEVVEVGRKVRNIRRGDAYLNPTGRIEPGTPYTRMWACMVEYAIVQDIPVMEELRVDPKLRANWATCRLPAGFPPEDAGVLLTLKECYSALRNFGFKPGMDVLVYGDGPVGLGLVSFMRQGGAGWIGCVGHRAPRLARIRRLGKADAVVDAKAEDVKHALGDRRCDLVIDAVGSTAIIKEGARRLKPGGKLGVYGVLKKKDATLSLLDLPNNVAIHMLNFPHGEQAVHDEVVNLVLSGKVNPKDFYSHTMPFERAAEAVAMVRSREAYKIVFKP